MHYTQVLVSVFKPPKQTNYGCWEITVHRHSEDKDKDINFFYALINYTSKHIPKRELPDKGHQQNSYPAT